jgi:hypothetical protein
MSGRSNLYRNPWLGLLRYQLKHFTACKFPRVPTDLNGAMIECTRSPNVRPPTFDDCAEFQKEASKGRLDQAAADYSPGPGRTPPKALETPKAGKRPGAFA